MFRDWYNYSYCIRILPLYWIFKTLRLQFVESTTTHMYVFYCKISCYFVLVFRIVQVFGKMLPQAVIQFNAICPKYIFLGARRQIDEVVPLCKFFGFRFSGCF